MARKQAATKCKANRITSSDVELSFLKGRSHKRRNGACYLSCLRHWEYPVLQREWMYCCGGHVTSCVGLLTCAGARVHLDVIMILCRSISSRGGVPTRLNGLGHMRTCVQSTAVLEPSRMREKYCFFCGCIFHLRPCELAGAPCLDKRR